MENEFGLPPSEANFCPTGAALNEVQPHAPSLRRFCNWHWVPRVFNQCSYPSPGSGRHKQSCPGQILPASPTLQTCFAKAKTLDVSSNPLQNHSLLSEQPEGFTENLPAVPVCNHRKSSLQTHELAFLRGRYYHLSSNPETLSCHMLLDTSVNTA